MRLTVTGKASKATIQETKEAFLFYVDQLIPKRLQRSLRVTIRFTPEMEPDTLAQCDWMGLNPVRPKTFTIRIWSKATRKKRLVALGHETVHIKQFVMGEMRDLPSTNFSEVTWMQKRYVHDEAVDALYWTRPWEIEAYGREHGLYVLYSKHIKEKKRQERLEK